MCKVFRTPYHTPQKFVFHPIPLGGGRLRARNLVQPSGYWSVRRSSWASSGSANNLRARGTFAAVAATNLTNLTSAIFSLTQAPVGSWYTSYPTPPADPTTRPFIHPTSGDELGAILAAFMTVWAHGKGQSDPDPSLPT